MEQMDQDNIKKENNILSEEEANKNLEQKKSEEKDNEEKISLETKVEEKNIEENKQEEKISEDEINEVEIYEEELYDEKEVEEQEEEIEIIAEKVESKEDEKESNNSEKDSKDKNKDIKDKKDVVKVKKKIINFAKVGNAISNYLERPLVKLTIFMTIILIIIAVFLVQEIEKVMNSNNAEYMLCEVDERNVFAEVDDEELNNFVKNYFQARSYLDFANIYRAFNKEHLLVEDSEEVKNYENGILYEKNYVSGYENVKVYQHKGLNENDTVVLVLFDVSFYFSNQLAPSMMVGYVVNDGKKLHFKENLNIGETKYVNSIIETYEVKKIYEDVKEKLEIALQNDDNLKLAYNSLRQYDMNPNNNVLDSKQTLIDKIFGNEKAKENELIDLAREKEE